MKNALGTFDQVVALTEGGPNSSTETVTYLIWKGGLTGGEYAYQTANAVLFFIVLAIIAFVQLRISRSQEQDVYKRQHIRALRSKAAPPAVAAWISAS